MGAVSNQKAYVLPRRGRPRTATRSHRLRLRSAVMITKAATDAIERVRADYVPAAFEGRARCG